MFDILLQLSFVFLVIMFTKNIMDMKKYNSESQIVELKDLNIDNDKRIMDPLLITYKFETRDIYDYISKNPLRHYCNGDMCIRLSDFDTLTDIHIYKNDDLHKDLNLKFISDSILEKFQNMYSFNNKYFCSLLKGNVEFKPEKNRNNICLIGCLHGDCVIYLYNPKHKSMLKDDNIKKYGIKIEFKKDELLYIPSEWYYSIHNTNDSVLLHLQCDTYFTSLYNEYRD